MAASRQPLDTAAGLRSLVTLAGFLNLPPYRQDSPAPPIAPSGGRAFFISVIRSGVVFIKNLRRLGANELMISKWLAERARPKRRGGRSSSGKRRNLAKCVNLPKRRTGGCMRNWRDGSCWVCGL